LPWRQRGENDLAIDLSNQDFLDFDAPLNGTNGDPVTVTGAALVMRGTGTLVGR
jgi:hypothetical protein